MKLTKAMKVLLSIFLIGIIAHMILTPYVKKEGFKGRKELLLLHMEGCPHCVKLMPEWDTFKEINNTPITTKAVEKDEDRSLVKRYGVEGFPTILLLDSNGNKLKTYNGPRTSQGLLNFCQQNS